MSDIDQGNSVVDIELELSEGIPACLDRRVQASFGDTSAAEETQDAPAFTTQVDDTGQTEVVVKEVPEEASQEPHNERAVIGGNNPPPSREELIKDFNKDVASFGKDSGKGSAALPRLGLRVIRAAADGLISTEKPKDGSKSDAVRIYEAYTANDSKHAEHTAGGMKANAAKLNALIGLGTMTTCDGVTVADRVVKLREEMEGADLKPKPLFAGLVDVAREQLANDVELTDDAIKGALTKTKADKTLEKEWAAIAKRVEGLVSGENSSGLKDQSPEAIQIQELVTARVTLFVAGGAREGLIEMLMERGYTRAMAETITDKE